MADENIVVFPRGYKGRPPQTLDEIRDAADDVALFHVDELLGPLISILLETIECAGFDIHPGEEFCVKDMAFVVTTLRSLLLKSRGISHPFQRIAEETFESLGGGDVIIKTTGESVVPEDDREIGELD